MDDMRNESQREAYEAPTVEDIPLRPDEQLLAGCKSSANPRGSSASGPTHFCFLCSSVQGS